MEYASWGCLDHTGGRLQFLDVELVRKKVMRIFEGKVLLSRKEVEAHRDLDI